MATRTAPTIDGTPTYWRCRTRWIDAMGKLRTITYRISVATDALVETFVQSLQSASNASLWEVEVGSVYSGAKSITNATADDVVSVWDNIVMLMGEATGRKFDIFLPAPENTLFVAGTTTPITTATPLSDITTAMAALQLLVYTPESYRFSQRKDKNARVIL